MDPETMEAAAEVIDATLAAYCIAHPRARASEVTALTLIAWVRKTAEAAEKAKN